MNLEPREIAYDEIMNEFIISLRLSPWMLTNPTNSLIHIIFQTMAGENLLEY